MKMKKKICLLVALVICVLLVGCGGGNIQEGKAKTPSGSSIQKGRDYQKVIENFEKNGFTNIKTEKIEDLVFGWLTKDGEVEEVSVGGDTNYSPDKWVAADTEVIIKYHTFPSKKTDEKTDDDLETPEFAKRAAVVALTNYFAMDVLTPDGNDYDVSKFHSYADTSGNAADYFMYVESWGIWTVIDNENWQVDNLILKSYGYGTTKRVALDVSYIGTSYIISNVKDTNGTNDSNTLSYESQSPCYTVPKRLVEEDRVDSEVAALDRSKELREDQAKRAFQYYGEHLYPYGFKCHWLTGTIAREQFYDGSWFLKVNVTITNQYGASRKAIAEAYINNTTQSVEDFYVH